MHARTASATLLCAAVALLLGAILSEAKEVRYTDMSARTKRGADGPIEINTQVAIVNSTHDYYNMLVFAPSSTVDSYWITPDKTWTSAPALARAYVHVDLSFAVPFFGAKYRSIKVTSGGFISFVPDNTPVTVVSYYVAPLLADFKADNEEIRWLDRGSSIVVQWSGLDLATNQTNKEFQFQCIIDREGKITFTYHKIPLRGDLVTPMDRGDGLHPVKAGLADAYQRAYMIDGEKVIINYHYASADIPLAKIEEGARVEFRPLPSCHSHTTCDACISSDSKFDCSWCPGTSRCSDGIDRYRNAYILSQCNKEEISVDSGEVCPAPAEKRKQTFTFSWSGSSFPADCWYWLGVRLDISDSSFSDKTTRPEEEGFQGIQVSFSLMGSEGEKLLIQEALASDATLTCGNSTSSLERVTAVSTTDDRFWSTDMIIVIACAGTFVLLIAAAIFWLVYAYRNPHTASGHWLINHRRCRDFCCISKVGSHSTSGGEAPDDMGRDPHFHSNLQEVDL